MEPRSKRLAKTTKKLLMAASFGFFMTSAALLAVFLNGTVMPITDESSALLFFSALFFAALSFLLQALAAMEGEGAEAVNGAV